MDTWRNKFQSHILERGHEYYENGYVGKIEKTESGYEAVVYGSRNYNVQVILHNDEIIDMVCDCPYAYEGNNCKHMAAVLLEIENMKNVTVAENGGDYKLNNNINNNVVSLDHVRMQKVLSAVEEKSVYKMDAYELLEMAEWEEVEAFLISEFESDERLLDRFRIFVTDIVEDPELQQMVMKIKDIFICYKDKTGFISYYMADELEDDLNEFISDYIDRSLLEYGKYEEAFILTKAIMEELRRVEIDDSDGIMMNMAYRCGDILERVILCGSDVLKNTLFDYLCEILRNEEQYYMFDDIDCIEKLWTENFLQEFYLKRKLNIIEEQLEKYEKKTGDYLYNYKIEKWINRYIKIAENLNLTEKEWDVFLRKYWSHSKVREHAVNICVEKGDTIKAIGILNESLNLDSEYLGLTASYSKRIADLYEGLDEGKYREALWDVVTKYDKGELQSFRCLKNCYSAEEWSLVRENIFSLIKSSVKNAVLYKEEKLYDRLLEYVKSQCNIWTLKQYERDLQPLYSGELLEIYTQVVQGMAAVSGDRKKYREIVKVLRKMKHYPNGVDRVKHIVDEWEIRYKNRPAMMDELDRL